MKLRLLLPLMLMGHALLACDIPIPSTWTISAPDPCQVMRGITEDARALDHRIYFDRYISQADPVPFKLIDLNETTFANLDIVEEFASFQCAGTVCLGVTRIKEDGRIELRYGRSFGALWVRFHELAHIVYLRRGYPGWDEVGHGTAGDPWIQAVNRAIALFWPSSGMVGFQGYLPQVK